MISAVLWRSPERRGRIGVHVTDCGDHAALTSRRLRRLAVIGRDEVGAETFPPRPCRVQHRSRDADPVDRRKTRGDLAAHEPDAAGTDRFQTKRLALFCFNTVAPKISPEEPCSSASSPALHSSLCSASYLTASRRPLRPSLVRGDPFNPSTSSGRTDSGARRIRANLSRQADSLHPGLPARRRR